jgi:hypothetical protein
MVSRFACIATARRRRALGAPLSVCTVRVRRASASLRRVAALEAALTLDALTASAPSRRDEPRVAGPEHTSRR